MSAVTRNGISPKEILVVSAISTQNIDFILFTLVCLLIALFYGVSMTASNLGFTLWW